MILIGHALDRLRELPENSVQCVATSPPYWGLRDYGVEGQLGLEKTPQEFVANMTAVFNEVRRVLKPDGTCWVNMGDSYCSTAPGTMGDKINQRGIMAGVSDRRAEASRKPRFNTPEGLKPKDLVGIPWRLAFALQDAGWYLRSDIIWSKPNPMPESVRDRPTKAHEYVFLLSKSENYYYDADAIAEPVTGTAHARGGGVTPKSRTADERYAVNRLHRPKNNGSFSAACSGLVETRNARTVWTIATQAYPEAHFATFPEELPRRCIMAGSREGDTVLDPFGGSGTTCAVAERLGRKWIYIDLNPEYAELAMKRIAAETPSLFKETAA